MATNSDIQSVCACFFLQEKGSHNNQTTDQLLQKSFELVVQLNGAVPGIDILPCEVQPNDRISHVKTLVQRCVGLPLDSYYFMFDGKRIDDETRTLLECGIRNHLEIVSSFQHTQLVPALRVSLRLIGGLTTDEVKAMTLNQLRQTSQEMGLPSNAIPEVMRLRIMARINQLPASADTDMSEAPTAATPAASAPATAIFPVLTGPTHQSQPFVVTTSNNQTSDIIMASAAPVADETPSASASVAATLAIDFLCCQTRFFVPSSQMRITPELTVRAVQPSHVNRLHDSIFKEGTESNNWWRNSMSTTSSTGNDVMLGVFLHDIVKQPAETGMDLSDVVRRNFNYVKGLSAEQLQELVGQQILEGNPIGSGSGSHRTTMVHQLETRRRSDGNSDATIQAFGFQAHDKDATIACPLRICFGESIVTLKCRFNG